MHGLTITPALMQVKHFRSVPQFILGIRDQLDTKAMTTLTPVQTRLLLLDDHLLFREGLVRLLATETEFEMVAQCSTVTEALSVLVNHTIDLVLLDFDLGDETGATLLQAMHSHGSTSRVLLVTAGISPLDEQRLREDGIGGIFHKQGSPATLLEAIRTVASGGTWFEPKDAPPSTQIKQNVDGLTSREHDVLRCVFQGLINKQIASRIGVSESTVKATLQQLFHKAGVRTRSQLVRFALDRSLGEQNTPGKQ